MFEGAKRAGICKIVFLWLISLLGGCVGMSGRGEITMKYYYTKTDDGFSLALRRY